MSLLSQRSTFITNTDGVQHQASVLTLWLDAGTQWFVSGSNMMSTAIKLNLILCCSHLFVPVLSTGKSNTCNSGKLENDTINMNKYRNIMKNNVNL